MYLGFLQAMSSLYFVQYLWRTGLVNWRYAHSILHPQHAFNCQSVWAKTGNHNTWCTTRHTGGDHSHTMGWRRNTLTHKATRTQRHPLMLSGYGECSEYSD